MKISVLEVSLRAIEDNIKSVKKIMLKNQKLCAVAKANCYGLGAKIICEKIDKYVDCFAVSSGDEFLELCNCVTKPILLLCPIYENITKLAIKNAVFTVSNFESFEVIKNEAKNNPSINFVINLAVNTGMNRFGFLNKFELIKVLNKIKKMQNIHIFSVFSHFYAGNVKEFAKNQLNKFSKFKNIVDGELKNNNIIYHICNSDSININLKYDMVRIGYSLYNDNKNSTISLKSKVVQIQKLKAGDTAGYSACYSAIKNARIAVVSIGYADGIFRRISGKGFVLINSNFCKIVAVCMDCILVDVSDVDCGVGDDVVLIGKNGDKQIFICDIADWCDTIGYEILVRISNRVKRVYLE